MLTHLRTAKSCPGHSQPGTLPSQTRPPPLDLRDTNTASKFKEDPDAWLLVDKILQEATYPQTKCMCLISGSVDQHTDVV